jgi:hypothetical protein
LLAIAEIQNKLETTALNRAKQEAADVFILKHTQSMECGKQESLHLGNKC